MPEAPAGPALEILQVEKQYGALRPFRIRELRLERGSCTALLGMDARAAEVFVNLVTGAILPDTGAVTTLGQLTSAIPGSDQWLAFVEHIGFVSDRVVLLDAMTTAQNLALPFDLQIDPIPPDVRSRIGQLANEVELGSSDFESVVGGLPPLVRAKISLARALALDPELVLLEHPTAALSLEGSRKYATMLRRTWVRRKLTLVTLTMDEKFARKVGGQLRHWQPATGDLAKGRRWF